MGSYPLDDVDRGILHMLQENARDATIEAMGERVGVSASTVRNRINDMEAAGIIEGYEPKINYDKAGFDLHTLYLCKAPTEQRERITRDVLDIGGVVRVYELLDSDKNIVVEGVAPDTNSLSETHDALAALGLTINDSIHVRNTHMQPFDHFGADIPEE